MALKFRPATEEERTRPTRVRASGAEYNTAIDELLKAGDEGLTVEVPSDRKVSTVAWGIKKLLEKRELKDKYSVASDKPNNLVIIKPL